MFINLALEPIIVNNILNTPIKIKKLINKYNINVLDLEKEIKKTEKELSSMLEDLTGDNFDMKAIDGLKKLLEGD